MGNGSSVLHTDSLIYRCDVIEGWRGFRVLQRVSVMYGSARQLTSRMEVNS